MKGTVYTFVDPRTMTQMRLVDTGDNAIYEKYCFYIKQGFKLVNSVECNHACCNKCANKTV